MIDKKTKKKLKNIRKEIKRLKKKYQKLEFKPCKCDADLRSKDEELQVLRQRISGLERDQDRCMLDSGGIRHGG
jgi:hypothetical protein